MKIAVIGVRGFPGIQGGVERHCENIYPRFDDSASMRVYRRKPYLTEESTHTYPNIEFKDLPSTRIKGFEAVWHTFICCLHLIFHRVDVVHIHNIGPGMFTPLLRLFGFKVVLTYHSANYEHEKWGTLSRLLLRMSEFFSLRFANRIIFVNKFQMAKCAPAIMKKSQYIPNGINDVSRSEKTDYVDSLNLEKGKYVLGVGRLTAEKGFEYLVEAINKIDEIPQLVIAGASDHNSSYYDKLRKLDKNNKVIFTGFASGEDLRQLYSHARLFVLSSVNEGFPLVMLEAMGYNLPMVVSDISATHLIELPQNYYAKVADVDSIIDRIREMYSLDEKPVYDLSEYDWHKVVKQMRNLFNDIVYNDK